MDTTADAVPVKGSEQQRQEQEHKKRNRIRLSCTTCREKKLKCNRSSPCDQCIKRGITATCDFVPYEVPKTGKGGKESGVSSRTPSAKPGPSVSHPRARPPALNEATLQGRLRHLEHLVQVLKSQRKDSAAGPPREVVDARDVQAEESTEAAQGPLSDDFACKEFRETAGPIHEDQRYFHGANWEGILDDITKLTNDLKTYDENPDTDPTFEMPPASQAGPVLLLGSFPPSTGTITEMLSYLPPRLVSDRLIARFFAGKEPAWLIFHIPSFLREYENFWKDPTQASLSYIGLLFLMISHAALFCLRGGEETMPGNLGTPMQMSDAFRVRGAQCLALDDYTKPGRHKAEGLLLYFGSEYLRQSDTALGLSVLLSIIIRLAMHMGFHRDPKHYKDMTPFEGEMRRRKWTLLAEIDALVSFQFGLPGNIQQRYYDTEPPSNLYDEDFDESTTVLPPSKPETERTPCLYTIVKARLSGAFSEILMAISSHTQVTYTEILRLDKKLEAAHDSFPATLRMRSFGASITDPIEVIMQRYWLELLYQKARSVLHRKWLAAAWMDTGYAYSRAACIDAATRTLKHQYDIHVEIQAGGRLSKDRWFMTSLSIHDFLLADMILCLEFSLALQAEKQGEKGEFKTPVNDKAHPVLPKERMLDILRTSRSIWQVMRKETSEANRAFKIISRMLSLSTGAEYESSPESIGNVPEHPAATEFGHKNGSSSSSSGFPGSGPNIFAQESVDPGSSSGTASPWTSQFAWMSNNPVNPRWTFGMPILSDVNVDTFDGLVDPNLGTDWSTWDSQIQNAAEDAQSIPWSSFFQPGGGSGL